jgi:hypothetical protein
VSSLHDLFGELGEEDGSVTRRPEDYDSRQGLTNEPIPNHEVISVQVLHALLRPLDEDSCQSESWSI